MCTIALIGSDGAGKTTIGRRLESEMPHRIKYIYMGINLEASSLLLPTTRLILEVKRALGWRPDMSGPPNPDQAKPPPRGFIRQRRAGLKSSLRLLNQIGEEYFRQIVAWYYQRRGYLVLFDRHFFADYYASDIADNNPNRPLTRRIHGFVLNHLYPKPDFVILLDAPASVLLARKGEGTIDLLERRRQEYLLLGDQVDRFEIVDASRDQDDVTHEILAIIQDFDESQRSGLIEVRDVQQ